MKQFNLGTVQQELIIHRCLTHNLSDMLIIAELMSVFFKIFTNTLSEV